MINVAIVQYEDTPMSEPQQVNVGQWHTTNPFKKSTNHSLVTESLKILKVMRPSSVRIGRREYRCPLMKHCRWTQQQCLVSSAVPSSCSLVYSTLIYKHEHGWVWNLNCNTVHICCSENVIPLSCSLDNCLWWVVEATESTDKSCKQDRDMVCANKVVLNFIQVQCRLVCK